MKLGTFLLGGLTGVAVVMMMRNNRTMNAVAGGIGQMMKQRVSDIKETALEKGMSVKFGGGMMSGMASGNRSGGDRHASPSSGQGLDQVERLASQDPKVKNEINEILNQNGHSHI